MTDKKPRLPTPRPEPTAADLAEQKVLSAAKAYRFGQLAVLVLVGGIIITLAITGHFLASYDRLVIWGLAPMLAASAGGIALLKVKWAAEREVEALDIAIRKLERARTA